MINISHTYLFVLFYFREKREQRLKMEKEAFFFRIIDIRQHKVATYVHRQTDTGLHSPVQCSL